jgi:hypothetical protein
VARFDALVKRWDKCISVGGERVEKYMFFPRFEYQVLHFMSMRWAGHVARIGENRNAYRILVGKPERKKNHREDIRRTWVDNIKMDLREIGWDGVDLIDMAQDRDQWRALVNTVLNLRVP